MRDSRPSSTARFVANGLWWISNHPQLSRELNADIPALNHHIVTAVNRGLFSARTKAGRTLLHLKCSVMQWIAMPGFYLHFALRKHCIEDFVRNALREGATQLIVLGAGYDTLSLRIAKEFPECAVIEVDHPATQSAKKMSLIPGNKIRNNLSFISLDFSSHSLFDILIEQCNYVPGRKSVFVAEGLLMYLKPGYVSQILRDIRENSEKGSRVVFTYIDEISMKNFQNRKAAWFIKKWLHMKGESYYWWINSDAIGRFVANYGLQLIENISHVELRNRYLSVFNGSATVASGENVAVVQNA